MIPPLSSDYVSQLEKSHEVLLDLTSEYILTEQAHLASASPESVLSDFAIGSNVTVSYSERPPNKLACRRAGPFQVMSREGNVFQLRNLINDQVQPFDISRLANSSLDQV